MLLRIFAQSSVPNLASLPWARMSVCRRDGCVWQRRVFATTARNLKIMPEMLPTTNVVMSFSQPLD